MKKYNKKRTLERVTDNTMETTSASLRGDYTLTTLINTQSALLYQLLVFVEHLIYPECSLSATEQTNQQAGWTDCLLEDVLLAFCLQV